MYEVKTHNRAGGSADVSASSLPRVRLTPLEIENGEALVHRRMVLRCGMHTNTHIRVQAFPIHGIYIPMQPLRERYFKT